MMSPYMFKVLLKDLDRIIFGSSSTFLVRIPIEGKIPVEMKVGDRIVDWEFC